jgi:hypothetical protein
MKAEKGRADRQSASVRSTSVRFAAIRALTAVYAAATVATVGFLAWRHGDRAIATDHAWGHAVIVLGFAVLMLSVARHAARGSRRALLRLRIIAVVIPVASLVMVAIPGFLPVWMRIEQAVYGVLLLVIAGLASDARLRSAARQP